MPELISSINNLIDIAISKSIPVFQVMTIHKSDRSTWNIVMKEHAFIQDEQEQLILSNREIAQLLADKCLE